MFTVIRAGERKIISTELVKQPSMEIATKLKIDRTFVAMNKHEGWKISEFIPNAKQLDYNNWDDVAQAMDLLRRLHQSGEKTEHSFAQFEGIIDFREKLKARNRFEFDGLEELDETVSLLKNYLQNDPKQVVLCHGDSYSPNFLLNEAGEMSLIDWEYSGMGEPAGDLGTFIACSNYTVADAEKYWNCIYKKYQIRKPNVITWLMQQ